MIESQETDIALGEEIKKAIRDGSIADTHYFFQELYKKLSGNEEVPEEIESVFESIPSFLEDLHKVNFEIPITPGDVHVSVFREDGKIRFSLSGKPSKKVTERYSTLGL